MATSFAPLSISVGGSNLKSPEQFLTKRNSSLLGVGPKLAVQRKSNLVTRRNLASPVRAEYRESRGGGGGGGDLVAGFILGGAIFGTLAYVFAPQIRRSLLNENEYGFRKARRPIYYDEGLEGTRQTLNEKIGQLNSAIDNISSRLRGNNNVPAAGPISDPEVEATK
ncbi:Low-density receptor protein [Trifolium repens]|nr:Low-density receptor protein [Trifolium repens]